MKVVIEKCVYGGYGLAFAEGKAVFVSYALAGDELEIDIIRQKKDVRFAEIRSIIKPSPLRITPSCPNFGICGGCDYLNISYDDELSIKKEIVIEQLVRVGKFTREDIPHIEMCYGPREFYRSRISVKSHNGIFGFSKKNTHDIIAIPCTGCRLADKRISDAIQHSQAVKNSAECAVGIDACGKIVFSPSDSILEENEENITYQHSIDSFFQRNLFLRGKMLTQVTHYAALSPQDRCADIGCGVGFFSIACAKHAGHVVAIDTNRAAIAFAKKNAELNTITNAGFFQGDASEIARYITKPDVCIIDPPRAGLSADARRIISGLEARRIVSVSCDPSTFARDTCFFTQHGYKLKKLTCIDMFPSTYHIELIGLLEKKPLP